MGIFFRSSSRTSLNTARYQAQYRKINDKIYALYARCEEIDPSGVQPVTQEEKAIREMIGVLSSKRAWLATQICVSIRMNQNKS